MSAFLILTTRDLPEAYFLATALEARGQRIGILSFTGRPLATQIRVLRRLRRNRGLVYLADLLLARLFSRVYLPAGVEPFPEIDHRVIADIKQRWPSLTCLDPHAPATLDFARAFDADYMLLAGTPVLKPALYSLARVGTLNRHLGMLPDYKGSDCPIWALAWNDLAHVGFSIHHVSERVDAGDVIHVGHVAATRGESFVSYLARLQRNASETFLSVIDRLLDGERVTAATQPSTGRFCPPAGLRAMRRARLNYERAMLSPRVSAADGAREPALPA